MSKIVCVVPTIRPESHAKFVQAWTPLFRKHKVTLITVWDGDIPRITVDGIDDLPEQEYSAYDLPHFEESCDLFCTKTDACRNLGFVMAADLKADYVLTLDDDVYPLSYGDPIQQHLDALNMSAPLCWMNTADSFHKEGMVYVRGVPYTSRKEAPVMLSHGVWYGVPDLDGETQLKCEKENKGFRDLYFHVGTIPKGVLFPLCGMNVMVRKEALPYFYFAPMGTDTGVSAPCNHKGCGKPHKGHIEEEREDGAYRHVPCPSCNGSGVMILNRFADIFMGIFLKREFDDLGWACATGYSAVHHSRASDAKKNMEAERLGREWLEEVASQSQVDLFYRRISYFDLGGTDTMLKYFRDYGAKRQKYAALIRDIQGSK